MNRFYLLAVFIVAEIAMSRPDAYLSAQEVSVKAEILSMPTYTMGPDEKQPIYRGFKVPGMKTFRAERTTYPYPRADNFGHRSEMVEYKAITLENEYIKAVIIPDLRGRLQGAWDKRNGWDFIYFNHAIKPGDIGNRGGWLSGGLEWNHPGGHGYTQFERISHSIIENGDGSKTVLVAEIEPVRMMKWETAITLRPGSLALETEGRFYSIAPYPVPFASSLNGAMHTSEKLEVIFPEGTYVTGHGKKYVEPWPVYNGLDHSWFSNLKQAYSVFSEGCTEDFYGCYSHDRNGGTVIVADHRTAPGKKYFSWGSHPAGRRWDKLLSDSDGGYIELQIGAFWENLGYGYAWLDPLEVKKYSVLWYPVKDIGGFVKANEHLVINLARQENQKIMLGLQSVVALEDCEIAIRAGKRVVHQETASLDPAEPRVEVFKLPAEVSFNDLEVSIRDAGNRLLMSYQPLAEFPPVPELPETRVAPEQAVSIDDLHMWGKGFYQDPFGEEAESYYREILERSPEDVRGNREMGLMALHRGQWEEAIRHLELSFRGDPLNDGFYNQYYMGLAWMQMDDPAAAEKAFRIASRIGSLKVPALYQLAVIEMQQENYAAARNLLKETIGSGGIHPVLYTTLALAHRKEGNSRAAADLLEQALAEDPLEFYALLEKWMSGNLSLEKIHELFFRTAPFTAEAAPYFAGSQLYIEGAVFYDRLGSITDAIRLLEEGIRFFPGKGRIYPMMEYYLAYLYHRNGQQEQAIEFAGRAGTRSPDYVFPYAVMDVRVLETAIMIDPGDARAWHYLGNALFYLRRYKEAEYAWQQSAGHDPGNASVLRSLAFVDWALRHDLQRAVKNMEEASLADPADARILFELDHFLDAAKMTDKRLELLSERESTVRSRDELVLSYARLLLRVGNFKKAAEMMDSRQFFARESRAMTHAVYAEAHYGVGEEWMAKGEFARAIEAFDRGMMYPENLGEGALANEVFARAQYLKGKAYALMGETSKGKALFKAISQSEVREETESVIYLALANKELGNEKEFLRLLNETVSRCMEQIAAGTGEESQLNYVLGRALQELGKENEAKEYLSKAMETDPDVVLNARMAASVHPVLIGEY